MKESRILLFVGLFALVSLAGTSALHSQEAAAKQRYEVAMIKFDGPDRIQYILPNKTEYVRIFKDAPLPKDIHDEEYCLTYAANKLAQDGWEPVNLNSTRILMRRPVK